MCIQLVWNCCSLVTFLVRCTQQDAALPWRRDSVSLLGRCAIIGVVAIEKVRVENSYS